MFSDSIFNLFDDSKKPYDFLDYDITTEGDVTTLEIAMPGFSKPEIEVSQDSGVLKIRTTKPKETKLVHNLDMDFTLNEKFSEVKAKYDAGILKITLVKQKAKDSEIISID